MDTTPIHLRSRLTPAELASLTPDQLAKRRASLKRAVRRHSVQIAMSTQVLNMTFPELERADAEAAGRRRR